MPPSLSLQIHNRYGRRDVFGLFGIEYSSQKQHLNTGLSPQNPDGGYLIFVTLNKEDLDPAYNYEDEIFRDLFTWTTRRGPTAAHPNYVNIRDSETRVSLFIRNRGGEDFVYAGEVEYLKHKEFTDPQSGKPQQRYVWKLRVPLPDSLLEEFSFSRTPTRVGARRSGGTTRRHRRPADLNALKGAYSYAIGECEREVNAEHLSYQLRLKDWFIKKRVVHEFENDFVDVAFKVDDSYFIGEVKVTTTLTIRQAFRAALGQLLDYGFDYANAPALVMFLDKPLAERELSIASSFRIAVVYWSGTEFRLQNPDPDSKLTSLFASLSEK